MNVGRLAARMGPSLRATRAGPSVRAATTDAAPKATSAAHSDDNELVRVEKRINEASVLCKQIEVCWSFCQTDRGVVASCKHVHNACTDQ